MSNANIDELDRRIANISAAICKLEGEKEGLQFARRLLTGNQSSSELPLVIPRPILPTATEQLATWQYALMAIKENPAGLSYGQVVKVASEKAGRELNPKTVSSALDELRHKKKQIVSIEGLYRISEAA